MPKAAISLRCGGILGDGSAVDLAIVEFLGDALVDVALALGVGGLPGGHGGLGLLAGLDGRDGNGEGVEATEGRSSRSGSPARPLSLVGGGKVQLLAHILGVIGLGGGRGGRYTFLVLLSPVGVFP